MEYVDASEILASVLKDVNEIIDATGTQNSKTLKPNDINGNFCQTDEEKSSISEKKKESKYSLLNVTLDEAIMDNSTELPSRINKEEKELNPSKSKRLLPETNSGSIAHRSSPVMKKINMDPKLRLSSVRPEPVANLDTEEETSDNLQARLIQLQKQVNAQAHRIAELEQKRKHPLNTVLGNVASLEKLDLLAEVSKQQLQIANLEKAKRELEMQVNELSSRLACFPLGMENNSEVRISGLGLDVIRRAATPEPKANKLNDNMCNDVPSLEDQATIGYLNAARLADQLTLHATSSAHLSPLMMQRNLAASRSYMLSSGGSHVNPNPMSGQGSARLFGQLHPIEALRSPPVSPLGINGHYKSASLNELRHHRTIPWDGKNNQNTLLRRLPRPIDWVEPVCGDSAVQFGPSPVDSTYNQVYTSTPPPQTSYPNPEIINSSTGPHYRLPPQYASDYHRQAYLNNRARSPPSGSARYELDFVDRQFALDSPSNQWYSAEMNPLSSSPCLFEPTAKPSTNVKANGLQGDLLNHRSPIMRRDSTTLGVRCEPRSFVTPPVGRRMLPYSPTNATLVNGATINQNVSASNETTNSIVNSRFKRILASAPFQRLLRHRNSSSRKNRHEMNPLPLPESKQENEHLTKYSFSSQFQPHLSDQNGTGNSINLLDPGPGQTRSSTTTTAFRIPKPRGPAILKRDVLVRPVLDDYGLEQNKGNLHQGSNGCSNPSPNSQIQPATPGSDNSLQNSKSHSTDFIHWDKDMVSAWLYQLGLGYSVPYARRWLQQGSDLVHASRKEIEQEMCIRNVLHLKKLYLHLQLRTKEQISIYANYPLLRVQYPIDFNMPAWLDDLGLTSYIAAFDAAAIDLLVLNHLTMADLVSLKMTNELHFLSLRRGLQMLRRMNYDLSRICRGQENAEDARRSQRGRVDPLVQKSSLKDMLPNGDVTTEVKSNGPLPSIMSQSVITSAGDDQSVTVTPPSPITGRRRTSLVCSKQFPLHVCYWSQYRVMAWLHQIELPEYAPELCGSGVHGALMVLEDRFTPDLLASILHIPSGKTLVRRHLTNKFAELVGEHIWERKQGVMETQDIPPLTTHSKNKHVRKRNLFSTNRKRKSNLLEEEFVCPVDIDAQHPEFFAEEPSQLDAEHMTPTDSTSIQLNSQEWDWTPSQSISLDTG